MPFIRTAVRNDTSQATRQAIVQGIHDALVAAIGMPADELFNIVQPYEPADYHYSRSFNGIARGEHAVVVDIPMRRGRSDAMKRDLYGRIAANLRDHARVSPKDVFIFIHENDYSDWSVGNGQFAMVLAQPRGGDA